MNIEKLPSGSYRVRKMYKRKMYTVIFSKKPTQKEVMMAISDKFEHENVKVERMTFAEAAKKYVEMKENVLSPRTVKEYADTPKRLSDRFTNMLISDITQIDVQEEINRLAADKSPKTVRNYHGFISAVLSTFNPNVRINTTLPKKRKKEPYIPTDEEVKKILAEISGSAFEVPILLACYGLRRSEICALSCEDFDGNIISINKAKVLNKNNEWVVKPYTKSAAGTRTITVPSFVTDKVMEQGYVYKGHPNSIGEHLFLVEDKLGIQRFSLHKFRHYFASKLSALNIPEADIIKLGGWETDHIMKSVYRHAEINRDFKAQQDVSDKLEKVLMTNSMTNN